MMARANLVLVVALLVCALALVTAEHRARKLFIDLQRAQGQARSLDIDWNRLLLEQSQLAKHGLIDPVARRELQMQPVPPDRTLFVSPASGPRDR